MPELTAIPPKKKLGDIVTERIKSLIVTNKLQTGDKLPSEKELMELLGVSRTVVREALKTLQVVGVVRTKSGEGIFVDDPSFKIVTNHVSFQWQNDAKKMKELLETRKLLELDAIELAIAHYDQSLIEAMEQWNEKINEQKVHFEVIDKGFHRSLFQAGGNSVFLQFSDILSEFFNAVGNDDPSYEEKAYQSYIEHKDIIHWIKRKNVKCAKQSMLLHLESIVT